MKRILITFVMLFVSICLIACDAASVTQANVENVIIADNSLASSAQYLYSSTTSSLTGSVNYNSLFGSSDQYQTITESGFALTAESNTLAVSMDMNTAAYANIRNYLNQGLYITPDMVKIEEMVNYFHYDYADPTGDEVMSMKANIIPCPWNDESKLLVVGLKASDIVTTELQNNLVFLLDVSGSMNRIDKLGLMIQAFNFLIETLDENDTISIVTYASNVSVVLSGANGSDKVTISEKVNALSASGSTAGAGGIQMAYSIAQDYFIEGGNNRVILATDGDFNVGITDLTELKDLISEKRDLGIYLSILGFGYGNLRDDLLETLATNGNGNYAYIDDVQEARKVMIEEIGSTLVTVARDAKAEIEFNPAKVEKYRLIGYENDILTSEEFENDNTDAGEIGQGHTVTAVYEIFLKDTDIESDLGNAYANFTFKYKLPDTNNDTVYTNTLIISEEQIPSELSEDLLFITSVIEFGLILIDSDYLNEANLNEIILRLSTLNCIQEDQYKNEFYQLVGNYLENIRND